jgi:hypothetical protein
LAGGKGLRFKLILAASLSVGWFLLFVILFKRRFPLGWFDEMLKSALQALGGA